MLHSIRPLRSDLVVQAYPPYFVNAARASPNETWKTPPTTHTQHQPEAQHKVQPVQFFVKGKVGMSTSVVRGSLEEILSQVIGTDGLDVYAMVNGKIVGLTFHAVVWWYH